MAEVPVAPIDDWVAKNYEELVADENRSVTYKSIQEDAEKHGDAQLAAWARARAAKKDADVNPTGASSTAPNKVIRNVVDDDGKFAIERFDILDVKASSSEPVNEGAQQKNADNTNVAPIQKQDSKK